MKKTFALLFLATFMLQTAFSQQMVLKKGKIMDSLLVHDSIPHTFSLYLPTTFTAHKKWPLVLVFDLKGRGRQALSMFAKAAETEGYILAAPKLSDTIALSNNMIRTTNVLRKMVAVLPIHKERMYSAGNSEGAHFANLTPIFLKNIKGVVSIGAPIANRDMLSVKRPFHFIGMVKESNYNYTEMLDTGKFLDRYRFPNQILLFESEKKWPNNDYLQKALQLFTLAAMGKNIVAKDSGYIDNAYEKDLIKATRLKNSAKLLLAEQYLGEMMSMYGAHKNLDSLKLVQKDIRRTKLYRSLKRAENATLLKESILKEDYQYYLEEDVLTHNFNNLGWWNYQMTEINKFINGYNAHEKKMGKRLLGYVNALVEDNIDIVNAKTLIDEDALAFLYMLKTILEPQNFDFYLKIISLSSKNEDFGTALFYLEEALKKGFKDMDRLYGLDHTALLRINPEFNKLVYKHLKNARYGIIEE